ncbi:MAG: phenylalanine--tRNA ligase subunit beta [Patescibacteria group bacterium]
MNLNISYNWLKEYLATKKSAHEFAKEISLCGPSVDFITEKKVNFEKVVVGQILELERHPDANKLNVCKVNIGKEILTIICGAPNIKIGQKVPVVLVGGKVGDIQVTKAKIRGRESFGMMCSQKELGISDEHAGIYILPDYVEIGLPLEKIIPLQDYIFDLEITSNRPDAMSIIGVAREASAIMAEKFLYKEPTPNLKIYKNVKLSVSIKEPSHCPRYQAVVMTDIKVDSSPLWVQQRLLSAGLRPINNLVDITNYILLEFGQPIHVFDYEKLQGREIIVRLAKKGEKILALDGKIYELNPENLVIADSKNPVAVAGVMGGESSAAHSETKIIVFEAANFDPVSVRKTARVLNLHSDSSNLFEKDLSPEGTYPALLRAIELTGELAGGKLASKIFDVKNYKEKKREIKLAVENVNKILGIELKKDKVKSILEGLGFKVSESAKIMAVSVPWWRDKDIEGEHDLIEEVARIYGYHKLPSHLPAGEIPINYSAGKEFLIEDKTKDILAGLGFAENYNYSFISEKLIKNCLLNINDHIKISNPLNLDFEYMRTTLIAGILQAVEENESNFEKIKIFELSGVYIKKENDLPDETMNLCLVLAGSNKEEAYFELKGALIGLFKRLNIADYDFKAVEGGGYWQKNQVLEIKAGGNSVGKIGSINQEILYLFGLKKSVAAAEIDFAKLMAAIKTSPTYTPLPKFPGLDLDLSMEIDQSVPYADIVSSVKELDPLIKDILFLSQYRGEKVADGKKAVAIRVVYLDENKTLKLEEAQSIHHRVVEELKKRYNIKVR